MYHFYEKIRQHSERVWEEGGPEANTVSGGNRDRSVSGVRASREASAVRAQSHSGRGAVKGVSAIKAGPAGRQASENWEVGRYGEGVGLCNLWF